MGIYDRDYGRDHGDSRQPGLHLGGPRSLSINLVLITFAVYGVQLLTQGNVRNDPGFFTNLFMLHGDILTRPWLLFEFLTYGFLHSPGDLMHILGNMFGLWMFGRAIESHYGQREFLAFYLLAIVAAGVTWYAATFFANGGQFPSPPMLGASGGVVAILILFTLNYPKQTIYFWGLFPLPMWVLGIFIIFSDVSGAMGSSLLERGGNVAFSAHLGGALFAFLYWRGGWKLQNWIPENLSLPQLKKQLRLKKKSDLRIHEPDEELNETDQRVDDILKKIQEHGQDSLTWRERRILEKASKEYQRKRQ